MALEVTRAQIGDLLAEAAAAYPREACGLLLGNGGRIEQVRTCRNVHAEPLRHFEIDPQALIDAHRAARAGGPEVIGYWHSHPDGPAEPSATDRAHATADASHATPRWLRRAA
jgi:proteasome lid subunit RPN8/RPN11